MSDEWERHVHFEQVWGTIVTFDLRGPRIDRVAASIACAAAADELHRIDRWLSPFRSDSTVSSIRAHGLASAKLPAEVREVIAGCAEVTRMTGGTFNPWRAPGGFDPCGYVKGWGADRAAAILVEHSFVNCSVNAAGDVTCRGSSDESDDGWLLGVADPANPSQVVATALVRDAHLATSGRYEQGDHIIDPETGNSAVAVDSASVLTKDGGLADALATALMVQGPAGLTALVNEPIDALLITGSNAWSLGEVFGSVRVGRAVAHSGGVA